jgi:hypothetical protein
MEKIVIENFKAYFKSNVLLIIIIAILLLIVSIINNKKIISFINKKKRVAICIYGISLVIIYIVFYIYTKLSTLKFLYFFNALVVIIYTINAYIEIKNADQYFSGYYSAIIFYTEVISLFSYINQSSIDKFVKGNGLLPYLFLFVIEIFVSTFIVWSIFYTTAKKLHVKNKNIDEIELKIVFLKSVLQSLTAAVAIFGLANSGLPKVIVLITLLIDAIAAFSYPILDINEYVRQKEIEQRNEKMRFDNYNY